MALKGSRLNLLFFLLNSLEKMAYVVPNTVGYKDQILFHNGVLNIMVQYQFSTIGKSWDQFLNENSFIQTMLWPSLIPKT